MFRTFVASLLALALTLPFAAAHPSVSQESAAPAAQVESPFEVVGVPAVDAAVSEYAAANAAWEAAADGDKAAAEPARAEAKTKAVDAIDAALENAEAGSAQREALADLRFELTGEAQDAGAVLRAIKKYVEDAKTWAIDNGPAMALKLVLIVVIYLVFKLLAGFVGGVVGKALSTPKIKASNLLKDFLIGLAKKAVMAIGLLVILTQLGIEVGPILAGLGVAGFVLGFALQDTLGNFAAGLMILFYRPYDVGDVVNAGGVTGSVDAMSLVSTTIKTPDNQRLIVPNSSIWGGVITNVTAAETRRVDLVFGIGYGDDMAQAERVLTELVEKHELCLKDPAPTIKVHELADSSVNFIVRPWVKTSDYWAVYWDLTRQVKEAFDREGISIPFPQRDVHLFQQAAEA